MRYRLRCAIITTRDRPHQFADCLKSVRPQVDYLVIISHMDQDYVRFTQGITHTIIPYWDDPPNISRMWNLGLDDVHKYAEDQGEKYDVAVLNDDVIVPPDWFARVTAGMRLRRSAAGCVRRSFDPRMCGYAFILNGDKGLRLDEQFQWWYGDTDLERRARAEGGVAFVRGQDVIHSSPGGFTVGKLAEIAGEDAKRYKEKWG